MNYNSLKNEKFFKEIYRKQELHFIAIELAFGTASK